MLLGNSKGRTQNTQKTQNNPENIDRKTKLLSPETRREELCIIDYVLCVVLRGLRILWLAVNGRRDDVYLSWKSAVRMLPSRMERLSWTQPFNDLSTFHVYV